MRANDNKGSCFHLLINNKSILRYFNNKRKKKKKKEKEKQIQRYIYLFVE